MVKIERNADNTSAESVPILLWDSSYAIVCALEQQHPTLKAESVGLNQLRTLIIDLPGFADDPTLAHDALLREILREWYEETTP